MILLYTGNGKGKTSASVGQAVRAHGQGLRVAFAQFMKRPGQAGEQKVLKDILQERFHVGGLGFFREESDRPDQEAAAAAVLAWAVEQQKNTDMLVLDESLYALGCGLLKKDEIQPLIDWARAHNTHLVLSGRGVPDWLAEQADLITTMQETKHPFASGHTAMKGIEF